MAYLVIVVAFEQADRLFDLGREPQASAQMIRDTSSMVVLVLAGLTVAGVVPVVEEVLFRAVLYLPLRRRIGRLPATLAVSAIFALAHLYIWGLPHLFVLSLLFIALYEKTKSLWMSILTHAAFNGVNIVLLRCL